MTDTAEKRVQMPLDELPEPGGSAFCDRPRAGAAILASNRAVCHGADGEGVVGLGPALADNAFVQTMDDHALVDFIVTGRPADHPDNTTGIAMPPRGGNPWLTTQDVADVVAHLRTLQ